MWGLVAMFMATMAAGEVVRRATKVDEPDIPRPDAPVGLPEESGFKKPTLGKIGASRGRTIISGALTPNTLKRGTLG